MVPWKWEKTKNHKMLQSADTYDVGTPWYENSTIKCKKKNKRTTEYDKSIVTCDVDTA